MRLPPVPSVVIDSNVWFHRFDPGPAGAACLVCLPHAGGSATFFRPVSADLAGLVEVLAVQYPGRQERRAEPVLTGIAELADRVAEQLLSLVDRPLVLFGHSMGAIVGFEVTARLERAGHRVHRLFVSGRRAPSCPREEYAHRLDDRGLIAELETLSGTDPGILGDRELLDMILPVVRADLSAIERYRAGPDHVVASPITVLVGDDDPKTTVDEARAWSTHTVGGCETVVFPGGHFYLVRHRTEVVKLIADRL